MRTLEERIKLITFELGETFEKGLSDESLFFNNGKLYHKDTYNFKNIGDFYLCEHSINKNTKYFERKIIDTPFNKNIYNNNNEEYFLSLEFSSLYNHDKKSSVFYINSLISIEQEKILTDIKIAENIKKIYDYYQSITDYYYGVKIHKMFEEKNGEVKTYYKVMFMSESFEDVEYFAISESMCFFDDYLFIQNLCLVLNKTYSVNFTIEELKENTKECYEHIKMIKY